jgi:mono/diheme cytochrome c family protein
MFAKQFGRQREAGYGFHHARGMSIASSSCVWRPSAGIPAAAGRVTPTGGNDMRMMTLTLLCSVALAAAVAAQDAKVAKGQQLFVDQKCTLCHSVGDKGNKKGPLDDVASRVSTDDMRGWLTDTKAMAAKKNATRKPEMKAYSLPKDDVDALIAYLSTLKK